MKLINYKNNIFFRIVFLFFIFSLPSFSNCSKSNYTDLNFIDLVMNEEDCIHKERMNNLNKKIYDRENEIESYKKKIRLTRQAINNLKIEISSYNSLIENITNKINNINQLNVVLGQFEQQIKDVEIEFDKVKKISAGLEKITKSEFLEYKKKGYFKKIKNWSEYLDIVNNAIEIKNEMDRYINSSKKGIAYIKANKNRILKKIVKKGAMKIIEHLNPVLLPIAIIDDANDLISIYNSFKNA